MLGNGSIGITTFLLFQDMINDVDSDGSGSIEFPGDCFHMAKIVCAKFDWKGGFRAV